MAYIEASAFIYQDGKVSILVENANKLLEIKTRHRIFFVWDTLFMMIMVQINLPLNFWHLKILIEVDHLQDVPSPYIQIKGANKEAVTAAGSALKLDGSYTTKVPTSFSKPRFFLHLHLHIIYT